jgi:GNAT superfamily N-acetyltransferase
MAGSVTIRRARAEDVADIVAMLADDPLGATREQPGDPRYAEAFAELDSDPRQLLAVADASGVVVGTMQLTFIPGLSRVGSTRALIEAVRVRSDQRGAGLGQRMIEWAIEQARQRGCAMVQLTTDASRVDAHRFYARLGFTASHVGMKLAL